MRHSTVGRVRALTRRRVDAQSLTKFVHFTGRGRSVDGIDHHVLGQLV